VHALDCQGTLLASLVTSLQVVCAHVAWRVCRMGACTTKLPTGTCTARQSIRCSAVDFHTLPTYCADSKECY
jgi:hypothetical protein